MPLLIYSSNTHNTGRLLVWKSSETTDELKSMYAFKPGEEQAFEEIRLEKRKREWLLTRILLETAASGSELYFQPTGKPMLRNGRWISISHCGELAGLVICDHPVGLDIQGADEKLERIAAKFCHLKELKRWWEAEHSLDYLTVVWSAKEAVFKFFGERVTFAEDIVTRPFHPDAERLRADYKGVHGRMTFELQHMLLNGYHIVMTV